MSAARGVLIASAAFAALCGVLIWLTAGGEAPPVSEAGPVERSASLDRAARQAEPPGAAVEPTVAAPPPALEPPPAPGPAPAKPAKERIVLEHTELLEASAAVTPRELADTLARLTTLLRHCQEDSLGRYQDPVSARVRFTLLKEGGGIQLGQPEIEALSVVDPYLRACLQDSVEETQLSAGEGEGVSVLEVGLRFEPEGPGGRPRAGR